MLIYDVAFSAETDELKGQLAKLRSEVDKIFKPDDSKGNAMFNSVLTQGKAAAQFLQSALQKATSVDGTSLNRFNAELRKSGVSASELVKYLSDAGMTQNLQALTSTLASADTKLNVMNDHLKEMHRVLSQSVKFRAAMAIQDFVVGQAQAAVKWTRDLNQNLVDIQVVSEKSAASMGRVFDTVIKKSKELNTTAKEYSQAALIFYQQGLPDDEVERRTDITIKAARAAGEDSLLMSKNLTAIWNTYQMQGDRLQNAASIAARLGADTAVDFKYIAEAMQTSATAAAQMGLSYENLAAIIATVGETSMQAASVVGNAYKTIISRFDQLKTTGTDGEVTLGRISQQLDDLGIHILDASGELKQMDQIIYETGSTWATYSQKQQIAVAEVLGGTRQFGQVLALFNNWDKFLKNASTAFAETGADTLEQQFLTASTSIQVAADQAAESWQRAFGKIANDELIKGFYQVVKATGDSVGTLIDSLGGVPQILGLIGAAFGKNIIKMLDNGMNRLSEFTANFSLMMKSGGTVSMGTAGKMRTGAAIAATQTGAAKENTEREFSKEYLQYYDQLNEKIRSGTEFQRVSAQADKDKFMALSAFLSKANLELEQYHQAATKAAVGADEDSAVGQMQQISAKITPEITEEDIVQIRERLQDIFGDDIELRLDTETPREQLEELAAHLEPLANIKIDEANLQKLREELRLAGETAEQVDQRILVLNEELMEIPDGDLKQIAAELKAAGKSAEEVEKEIARLSSVITESSKAAAKAKKAEIAEAEKLRDRIKQITAEIKATEAAANKADLARPFVDGARAAANVISTTQNLNDQLKGVSVPQLNFGNLLQGISMTTLGITSLISMFQNLASSEGSFFEKLTQSVMTLAFSLPMLIGGFAKVSETLMPMIAGYDALILAKSAVSVLNQKEVAEETLNALAKQAGVANADALAGAELRAAIAKQLGLVSTTNATTGEVTYTVAKGSGAIATGIATVVQWAYNLALWMGVPPAFALAAAILIIVAAVALLAIAVSAIIGWFNRHKKAAEDNAKAMTELTKKMDEAAAAAQKLEGEIAGLTKTLEDQRNAGEDTTETMDQLTNKLGELRETYRDLGVSESTIALIAQSEALGIAANDWDAYNEAIKTANREAIQSAGELAKVQAQAQIDMARYALAGAKGTKEGDLKVTVSKDVEVLKDIVKKYKDDFGDASGNLTLKMDVSGDPEKFVESYEKLSRLAVDLAAAGRSNTDGTKRLNEQLAATKDYYEQIKAATGKIETATFAKVIDDLRMAQPKGEAKLFTDESITDIAEYRRQLELLTEKLMQTGLSFDQAREKAKNFLITQGPNIQGFAARVAVSDAFLETAARATMPQVDTTGLQLAAERVNAANAEVYAAEQRLANAQQMDKDIDKILGLQSVGRTKLTEEQYNEYVKLATGLGYAEDAVKKYLDTGSYYTSVSEARTRADQAETAALGEQTTAVAEQTAALADQAKAQTDYTAAMEKAVEAQKKAISDQINAWFDNLSKEDFEFAAKIKIENIEFDPAAIQESLDKALVNIKLDTRFMSEDIQGTGRLSADDEKAYKTTAEAFEYYADKMAEGAEASIDASKGQQVLAENVKKVAHESLLSGAGLELMVDTFKDYEDILKKAKTDSAAKGTMEYAKAITQLRQGMSQLLGISEKALSAAFMDNADNMKLMEEAAKGSAEAIEKLRDAAGRDILLTIGIEKELTQGAIDELYGYHQQIMDYFSANPVQMGVSLNDAGLLAAAQGIIDTAQMTATQAQAYFDSIGYEPEITVETGSFETPTTVTAMEADPPTLGFVDVPPTKVGFLEIPSKPYPYIASQTSRSYEMPGEPHITTITEPTILPKGSSVSKGSTWKVTNLTKKATGTAIQGAKPSGGGGGKKGGGGSKDKDKGKAPKADTSILERYADIENVIDDTTRSVERLSSAEQHLFGTARLAAMQRKQKELLKLASAQAKYASEARKYYDIDKANFMTGAGDTAKFDKYGYLTNIEDVRKKWQNEIDIAFKEWQAVYDKLPEKLNEAQEAELKAAEERYKARKEFVDGEIEKLEQLLTTEAKIKEQVDAATETFRQMMQSKLDEASYKMNLRIQITDMDLKYLDYLAKRIDRMGSGAKKTSGFFTNLNSEIRTLIKQSGYVAENVTRLNEIMNNIQDSSKHKGWFIDQLSNQGYSKDMANEIWDTFQETGRMDAEIIDLLMGDADKLLEINQALFDAMYSAWDHYIATFEDFMEKFDDIVGRYEALGERITNINGLLAVFGMTSTRNTQQVKNLGTQFELSGQKMAAFKVKAEEAAAWAADAKSHLDYALASGNQDLINEAERTYDQLQKTADEAYDDYLASMKQFADDYVEIWGQMVDLIVANFSAQIFPLATSMDAALESLDLQREVGNFWLDAYQSGYQYERLLRKIAEDTESITDPAQRALYDEIQAEILEKQRAGALVTEKDVELWEKRLNIAKAQAAFEDAQKAKNTMRLARDASGNWSYVYSTDQTKQDDSAQKKADAEYDYYTAVKNAIDDYSAKLRETEAASLAYYQERAKQRALINAEDTAALEKFDAETKAQMDRYTSLIMWYAGKIDDYAGYIGLSHEDMALTITSGYQSATEEALAYLDGVQNTLVPELNAAETKMRDDAAYYLGQIGVSFQTLGDVAETEMERIKTEAESLSLKLKDVQERSQRTLEQMSNDMRQLMEDWVGYIDAMIKANEALFESIRKLAGEMAGIGDGVGSDSALKYDKGTDYAELIGKLIEEVNQNPEKYGGTWKAGENSAAALRLIQNDPYLSAQLKELEKLRDAKIAGEGMTNYGPTEDLINLIGGGSVGWDNTIGGWVYWDKTKTKRVAISYEDMQRMVNSDWRPPGFNAGGLVISPDGRGSSAGDIVPAMMTPGEYVLNPKDTQEFFKTFQAFLAAPNFHGISGYGTGTLEQMVQIYADFPNVSSRDEIQAALNNLINQAKQFNV